MSPQPSFMYTTIRTYASRTQVMPRTRKAHKPPSRLTDPLSDSGTGVKTFEEDNLTFIHRPPPTAPTPYSTTVEPASPLLRPPTESADVPLPPLLRPSSYVKEPRRLTEHQMNKIRRLRQENPDKYTRNKLAEMFKCTSHFVAQIAALPPTKRKEATKKRDEEHEKIRQNWGDKKSLFAEIRKKRREFW